MYGVDISILISTIRGDLVVPLIDSINKTKTNYTYEILLYGNVNIVLPNVRCITYHTPIDTVTAYNMLYRTSVGDCIIGLTDDISLNGNIFNVYDELKSDFKNSRFKLTTLLSQFGNTILPRELGCNPKGFIAHYPCILRETIENELCGVMQNEMFIHHCVDNWLGHYIYESGEILASSKSCHITYLNEVKLNRSLTNSDHDEHDREVMRRLVDVMKNNANISYNHSFIDFSVKGRTVPKMLKW